LAVKGIIDYTKDKAIGGLGWCIIAILISLWMLAISLFRIIQTMFFYF